MHIYLYISITHLFLAQLELPNASNPSPPLPVSFQCLDNVPVSNKMTKERHGACNHKND